MQTTLKILTVLLFTFSFHPEAGADVIEQKDLNFEVNTSTMGKDVHFSFAQLKVSTLMENYPELAKLDSQKLLKNKDAFIVLSKVAYLVTKPIGFFDHATLSQEKFIKSTLGDQVVKKITEDTFYVSSKAKNGISYKLKTYFDSDEVSTLPHAKVNEAVAAFKKLDVISQSASSIMFREMSQFSGYAWGAINVSAFIPLLEERTLVISYYLTAVKKESANKKQARADLKEEFAALPKIIGNYQAP